MSLVGQQVRQYRILSRLGEGGMGDVYEALDETLQRKVALKAIKPGRGLDPVTRDRFLREARILSQMDHPGICRIHDYIQVDGGDYLVLELIEGRTLTDARAGLDRGAKLRIARQITQVLAVAHAEDVIHRDLKPDNVMITPAGEVKVLDFGLARSGGPDSATVGTVPAAEPDAPGDTIGLEGPAFDATVALESDTNANTTMPGAVVGTPAFMSPEQARGDAVGPATDMYSLGLTLHWLFSGHRGYSQVRDVFKLMEEVKAGRTEPLTGQGLDPHLVRLVESLKSPSRASRPTASASLERLDWILDKPRRRNRRLAGVAVVAALLGFGLKYTLDVRAQRQVAERHRAEAEGLIEFMVGDRDKLAPVGRLDVLDGVGRKALEYYEAREEDELSDPDRFRLVRTLTQIGEVRLDEGDLEAAEAAFERARLSAAALHLHDPLNAEWLAALSAAHFWLGNIRYLEDDLAGADAEFRTYYNHSRRLREIEPDNPAWRLEVGYATTNLAALSEARGDIPAALAYLDSSIVIKKELVAEYPDDQDKLASLANSLAWSGRTLGDQGDLTGALDRCLEAEQAATRLSTADPRNMDHLSFLATQHQLVGNLLAQLGRTNEARRRFEADLAIASSLVDHDPANVSWRLEKATSVRSLGLHLVRMGDLAPARVHLEEARDIETATLDDQDDDSVTWEHRALTAKSLARLDRAEGRPDAARAHLADIILRLENLGGDTLPGELPLIYGDILVLDAELARAAGKEVAAEASLGRAEELLGPLADGSLDPALLVPWVKLLVLSDRPDEARRVAADLFFLGFARQDFMDYCRRNDLS